MCFIELGSKILSAQACFLRNWLFRRSHIYVYRYEREFLAAAGTFAFMFMQDFIWRLQFRPFIQHVATALTGNTLRHKHCAPLANQGINVHGVFIGC